ncbi:hypothetical protein OG943_37500 [Amycolatopsis sp. NBC_00345]|uniref:hypothetical protein n=1 Tax=Amycolatopsis sp. NBC_00345 TaxID=2975955 RepID=UPI002E274150
MTVRPESERVHAWEPDPAVPAGALPLFGEFMVKVRRRAVGETVFAALLTLGGVALFFGDVGIVTPIFVVVIFGAYLALGVYNLVVSLWMKPLLKARFELVECTPDAAFAAGSTIGVRLPDGRWLRTKLPEGMRLQLFGQRRLWLLRLGDRAVVTVPGVLLVRSGRIQDEPIPDAQPLPVASVEPTSPRLDPVLAAHRRDAARLMAWFAVAILVVFVWAAWSGVGFALDTPLAAIPAGVVLIGLALAALPIVGSIILMRRPLPHDTWTELRVVLDGPIQVSGRGVARFRGHTTLPDGRPIAFRGPRVPLSVVVNVAATGQLWTAGLPRPGKGAVAGVPGHAVYGVVRFG